MSLCCNSHASPLSWSVPCYLKLCAKGRNNSQHCWANNVGRCCVRVGDSVQKDATTPNNLRTCSTRGKDTTHQTFLNTLILSWRVPGPNNVGRAVQTDPTLLRYASTITDQKKCWELFAQKFDRSQTSLRATACRRVWKRTQHVTPNNVASVCTGLCGACFLLLKSL